jgi:hypothetical protein
MLPARRLSGPESTPIRSQLTYRQRSGTAQDPAAGVVASWCSLVTPDHLSRVGTMGMSGREREVVAALVETKAVDFEAIGKALATFGPTMALDMDFEDGFCGTMRTFVRVFRPWTGGTIDEVGQAVTEELQG